MYIKRRCCLRVKTGENVYRDWTTVARGARIAGGFAAF